ncbi:MAG: Kae1-associated kinase Bud32 [Candidatus Bathyarchaeota archaeon]|nr:MAG: Kae1-associated kinase Bud32 [Candidatus Bathyarchaeota archaeon]
MHGGLQEMLVRKGAEASLFLEEWQGNQVILKHRIPKKYRHPQIDGRIRSYRTLHESQLLHEAKVAGVPTPVIFSVDLHESKILMEFIEGPRVKELLITLSLEARTLLCRQIGRMIGCLHKNHIIHGDLTTSNMILTGDGRVVFLDFGLGEKTAALESRGVDLHLMKRAFQSTHFRIAETCFAAILEGYVDVLGKILANRVVKKIREIELRGRYISGRSEHEH